jgi:hypothetical protein
MPEKQKPAESILPKIPLHDSEFEIVGSEVVPARQQKTKGFPSVSYEECDYIQSSLKNISVIELP